MFYMKMINHCHLLLTPLLFVLLEVSSFTIEEADSEYKSELNFNATETETPTLMIIICSLAFLSIFIVVIMKCTDCYNPEVSSENHPACSDQQQKKWGGAVGYTSAYASGPNNAGFRETVDLTQSNVLPYAMIPTNVPSSGGFQGYSQTEQQDNSSQPSGALGYQGSVRSDISYGNTRNYNPIDSQEPPPTYETAARHNSFR